MEGPNLTVRQLSVKELKLRENRLRSIAKGRNYTPTYQKVEEVGKLIFPEDRSHRDALHDDTSPCHGDQSMFYGRALVPDRDGHRDGVN
jgi:hypothetical protein